MLLDVRDDRLSKVDMSAILRKYKLLVFAVRKTFEEVERAKVRRKYHAKSPMAIPRGAETCLYRVLLTQMWRNRARCVLFEQTCSILLVCEASRNLTVPPWRYDPKQFSLNGLCVSEWVAGTRLPFACTTKNTQKSLY